jgi:nucleoside-diphosphate-sugar epimerase
MKLMVLGGAGYVGTEVSARLVGHGHSVTVVDPLWFGQYFDYDVTVREQSSFDLDVADFAGCDVVIHLAAMSNDPMAEYDPARNFVLNQSSVTHAAFLARRAGVRRFVYASTCSVYGNVGGALCDETSPVDYGSAYSASKLFGEQALLALGTDDFSVISLRKGTISGYARRMRLDLLLNTMVVHALSTGTVTVHDPEAWRPLLGIGDAVSAYEKAVAAPPGVQGVFNIASVNVSVLQAAEAVAEVMAETLGAQIGLEVQNLVDRRSYRADWTKASAELGFAPRDTMRSIILDILEHRSAYQDVAAPHFYNIRALKTMPAGRLI